MDILFDGRIGWASVVLARTSGSRACRPKATRVALVLSTAATDGKNICGNVAANQ